MVSRAASWIRFPLGEGRSTAHDLWVLRGQRSATPKTSGETCRIALKQAGSRQGIKARAGISLAEDTRSFGNACSANAKSP